MAASSTALVRGNPKRPLIQDVDIPDEIWEFIISKLSKNDHDDNHIEPISLVSKRLLSITNRLKRNLPTFKIPIGAGSYQKLLGRFPNITSLFFRGSVIKVDEIILELARFQLPIQVLSFSRISHIFPVDSICRLPIETRSTVRSLILKDNLFITNYELGIIGDLFPNLKELDFSNALSAWGMLKLDMGIDLLASKLHGLKRIALKNTQSLSDVSVVSLSKNCPDLEEIELKGCEFVTEAGVKLLLTCCKKLKSIGLERIKLVVSPEVTHALSSAKSLQKIDLSSMSISDEFLYALAKVDHLPLKSFSLSDCTNFTSVGMFQFLEAYQFLDCFAVKGASCLTDRAMEDLSSFLQRAKTVKLNYCRNLSGPTFFAMIKNCPVLDTLEMRFTSIGIISVAHNAVNSRIRVLDLSFNSNLCNSTLRKIAMSCPNIEVLLLSFCSHISQIGIGYIFSNCPGLRHIRFRGCKRVTKLAKLCHTKLEILWMSDTMIDDEALFLVAKHCPDLRYLDVEGCKGVTKKGTDKVLEKCLKLKSICKMQLQMWN